MMVRILLIIVSFGSVLVAGERMSQIHLTKPLEVQDKVVITGVGYGKRRATIRFYDDHLTCQGRRRAVNGLVLVLQSRRAQLKIGTKTERTNCRDGGFTIPRFAPEIRHSHQYVITVSILTRGFSVRIGNGQHDRVIHRTKNSIGSIDWIRATSGNFSNIIVKRRVTLPLVSHCGKRFSRLSEPIASRFEVNLDAIPGDYPWQVAIRKKHVFVWSPVKHFCGATLISSCWVLTAAHCTRRMRGREDDFYVRVGDFNNNDNSQSQLDEAQEDLSIEKVFIHEQYDEASSDAPVHDVSLIKLNGTNGKCATFSVYVNPACLPVQGSDNFTASDSCEISGWGAQSYHQSQSDFPNILQRGTVSLYGFDHCRRLYGRGRNSNKYRIQEGMLCAGGDVDACQGDSGGPLACQRDTTYKLSPFVLWGITSWGEGCALQNRPGVYTDVSHYMPWILDTISSNSD